MPVGNRERERESHFMLIDGSVLAPEREREAESSADDDGGEENSEVSVDDNLFLGHLTNVSILYFRSWYFIHNPIREYHYVTV